MSSRPWVGWAWRPSPALITWISGATCFAIRYGAPLEACRTMNMSACIAARLATVSSTDSPLVAEEMLIARLITSAERRFAAISKVVRVRVEGSKKRLNTALPRSSGTFFTSRSVTPTNDLAVSRICHRIAEGSPSSVSRWCSSPFLLSCGFLASSHIRRALVVQRKGEPSMPVALQLDPLAGRDAHRRADELRGDRELASAAVDQCRKADTRRTPVIEELVHGGANRAAGIEHVVDEYERAAFDFERDVGALHVLVEPDGAVIVAVEGDVERAERNFEPQRCVQAFGEPDAAGVDSDQAGFAPDFGAHFFGERLEQLLGVGKRRSRHGCGGFRVA